MPLVLPDGTLLAENGLDRKRKLVFRIDPEMLKYIPKPEACTPEAVKAAYGFLRDEWLCDVQTDAEGKAILIASAMSILERVLFPARPTYFVTAGLRGGGKTTTLAMIIYAVTGVKPSARAWTSNVDERRKSLLAILSAGMPAVVWDNVPRGTAINCQYIEAASTTEVYQDRILGVTEDRLAPAYTIMFFTGNNIHPHEDQASRSLEVSLDTDRPDPENRDFKHPDPMGWTRDHRGQILGALYTILTGNPRRSGPQETRFKDWMALVGTAVEYAAELADERPADERTTPVVSFKAAYERVEASDDASANRASILEALHGFFPLGVKFDAGRVISRLKQSEKWSEDNHVPEDTCIVDLRHFCMSRRANVPSAKSANLALKTILKAPARTEAGMLTLRCEVDTHVRRTSFYVEFKSDKAKEERAPEVKEVDFDEEFPFEKPVHVPEWAHDFAKALGYEIRPWSELEALLGANAKPSV